MALTSAGRATAFVFFFGSVLSISVGVPSHAGAATNVVVTIKPVHSLVARIMDGVGTPRLLVEGSASPHTFALRPSAARAVSDADVFVRVSESVEPFTRRLVAAAPSSTTVVTLGEAPGMVLYATRSGGSFEATTGDDHHDHVTDQGDGRERRVDGHIWLDPNNAKIIVDVVTGVLAKRYPDFRDKFAQNAQRINADLDALSAAIRQELTGVRGKPFVVFHDSTQYFERAFGLAAEGALAASTHVQPSGRRLVDVRKRIRDLGAVCVFAEPGFQPQLLAAVIEGSEARSGTLDVEGQMLEPGPGHYEVLLRNLAHDLAACLASSN